MRITTTIAALVLLAGVAFAQPTTDEEFRYMFAGYPETLRMGLDVKKGYTVSDHRGTVNAEGYAINYKALNRDGDERPCGMIMVVTDPKQRKHYVAISRMESDVKFFTSSIEQVRTILNLNAPNGDVQTHVSALFGGLIHLAQP